MFSTHLEFVLPKVGWPQEMGKSDSMYEGIAGGVDVGVKPTNASILFPEIQKELLVICF